MRTSLRPYISIAKARGIAGGKHGKVLGLRITVDEQNHLLLYDLKTGERLLSDEEARIQAETRAEQAETENARLVEEIERLRRQLAEK